MTSRRLFLAIAASVLVVAAGCASAPSLQETTPIVFVHGDGESAAIWQPMLWRFESNGWPRDRLHAIDLPYPQARDDDTKPQAGRTSTAEHMAYLKSEVEQVLRTTGAKQVILMGSSRGGFAIRNYIQNGGGAQTVSHAILGGTPNHGVHAVKGFHEGNEFSGVGPFLTALNTPKNAAGDEVTGPVKWLTIRSDNNDKYAQPDGRWIGVKELKTNITSEGPALKGATNVVIAGLDHRETGLSAAAFDAAYRFLTGHAPRAAAIIREEHPALSGKVTGLGLSPTDPKSGDFSDNLPLPGAHLDIYRVDPATGDRLGQAVYGKTVAADGLWGPFVADPGTPYEFVITAPGYATTHIYRSPFPRSSSIVHLRAERIPAADRNFKALLRMTRAKGYLDPTRDRMSFDGQSPPPGALPGAGIASSWLKLASAEPRPVVAEFNGERVVGRTWPAADNQLAILELTY